MWKALIHWLCDYSILSIIFWERWYYRQYKRPRYSDDIDFQLHLHQIKGKWAFVIFTSFSRIMLSSSKTCFYCWKKSCVDTGNYRQVFIIRNVRKIYATRILYLDKFVDTSNVEHRSSNSKMFAFIWNKQFQLFILCSRANFPKQCVHENLF